MKLYDAVWAPSPRRVRIFLAEKRLEIDREMVDLRTYANLEPAYLGVNPRGTVPALRLDDGEVIPDSVAICRYLEALHPDPPLFGRNAKEIALVEYWSRRIEQEAYAGAVYAFRNTNPAFKDRGAPGQWPAVPQIPELAERGRIMWPDFIAALDRRLGDVHWIAGDAYSFADIMGLTTVEFARAAKLTVPDACTHVIRWYEAAKARPSATA